MIVSASGEPLNILILGGGIRMIWETPSYQDVRFGFEVTMYINNR
jgi:coenzyme PQQ precursor peptide PqqA